MYKNYICGRTDMFSEPLYTARDNKFLEEHVFPKHRPAAGRQGQQFNMATPGHLLTSTRTFTPGLRQIAIYLHSLEHFTINGLIYYLH